MTSVEMPPVESRDAKNGVELNRATILSADDHPDIPNVRETEGQESVPSAVNTESATQIMSTENFARLNVSPLWSIMHKMVPPRPNPRAVTTKWPYSQMRPELLKAADTVSAEEAERRVLILVNQAMQAPCTTDTIYAGLQIVMPGEIAPAHRHRAFALRFVIEGTAGFTAVEGEKITMFPGDVILTPSWTWHDHGNEGKDPIIWLDGLDLPLWQFLPINFLQMYSESRYPSTDAPNSALRFPWSDVAKVLDADPAQHAKYHYRHRDGSHLSKTISAQAERISPGHSTSESQEVFSFVYHIFAGEGYTMIKDPNTGNEEKIVWRGKDTFAVPAWRIISHTCTSSSDSAYLFAINDRPITEALTFAGTEVLDS
jgi:gentisate 1,2-dioxygenase